MNNKQKVAFSRIPTAQAAMLLVAALGAHGALAQAPASGGGAQLPPVNVSDRPAGYGARDSTAAGALGPRALIDTPFSINVVTDALIADQQARLLTEVLRNDPSAVTAFGGGYTSYQSISLRGFGLSNTANFRRDGLPFTHLSETPFENVERVEVLKGLSGFLYGFASPGGIVNVVPKKPTAQPLRSVRLGVTSQSLFAASVDLGGRFGAEDRFGYRINLAREQGETAIDDADVRRSLASAYLDWRLTPSLVLGLDLESHRITPRGQPLYYQLAPGVPVPAAPDLRRFNGVSYAGYATRDTMLGLRADWAIDDRGSLHASFLDHDHRRDAWFPSATITNAAGDLSVNLSRDALQEYPSRSAQAVLTGQLDAGGLRHELSAGVNWNTNQGLRGDYIDAPRYPSNLYNPVAAPASNLFALRGQYRSARSVERAVFVSDTLHLSPRWQLIAGVRHAELSTRGYNFTGSQTSAYDKSATTPSVALVFKPQPTLALYGSFVEGLEQGGTAPAAAANAGEVFAPLKSRQVEAGVKWESANGLNLAAAVFRIDKGLGYIDPVSNRYTQEGSQVHTGLEVTASGQVTRDLALVAGTMLLDAQAERTGNPAIDGRRPVNVPRHTANVHADWRIAAVPGLAVNAGVQWVGDRAVDANNARFIPGYGLVHLGARYETQWAGRRTVLRLNVDNAANKNYWAAATPTLYAGLPRTVKLSVQVDL